MALLLCLLHAPAWAGVSGAASADPVPKPHLTAAQAINLARQFCQQIGQPVSGAATAVFPLPDGDGFYYWQPCWRITFGQQATVELADPTQVITRYSNEAYFDHLNQSPAGQAMTKQAALKRCQDIIQATHQQEQLIPVSQRLANSSPAHQAWGYVWNMDWERAFHGVPYFDEHLSIGLDAQTGALTGMALLYASPPPTRATVTVSSSAAVQIAIQDLIASGLQGGASLNGVKQEVEQPGYNWRQMEAATGQPVTARVAWTVSFNLGYGEDSIWVDARTGNVLGGAGALPGGPWPNSQPFHPQLASLLPQITAVSVRRADPAAKGGWAAVKAAAFTAKQQPQQIKQLAQAKATKAAAPATTAPEQLAAQLVLVGKDNRIGVYGYDPATGRLGAGKDWVTVPASFQAWMQKRLDTAATVAAAKSGQVGK